MKKFITSCTLFNSIKHIWLKKNLKKTVFKNSCHVYYITLLMYDSKPFSFNETDNQARLTVLGSMSSLPILLKMVCVVQHSDDGSVGASDDRQQAVTGWTHSAASQRARLSTVQAFHPYRWEETRLNTRIFGSYFIQVSFALDPSFRSFRIHLRFFTSLPYRWDFRNFIELLLSDSQPRFPICISTFYPDTYWRFSAWISNSDVFTR